MSTFKSNQGTMSNKELEKRSKFWSRKQFRTWNKKELEKDSTKMQKLLAALKEFSMDEIKAIRELGAGRAKVYEERVREYIVRNADQRELDYAVSIAPKTFKVKQGLTE